MKAYKAGGMEGFFAAWEREHPRSKYPNQGTISLITQAADSMSAEDIDQRLASHQPVRRVDEIILREFVEPVVSELFMHQGQPVPEPPSHTAEVYGRGQAVKVIMYDMVTQYGIVNRAFYKKRGINRAIPNDTGRQLWYEIDMIVGPQAGQTLEVPADEVFGRS